MKSARQEIEPKAGFIDLRLRILDDGSDLFASLASLPTNAAKNIRASHLMYLGMLVESGRIVASSAGANAPAANDSSVKSPAKPSKVSPNVPSAERESDSQGGLPGGPVNISDLQDFIA